MFGSVAAFTAYSWLLGVAPTSQVATYAYVNPVVAVGLGALVLGERVTPLTAVGGLVTVVGVAVVVSQEGRRRRGGGAGARRAARRRRRSRWAGSRRVRGPAPETAGEHVTDEVLVERRGAVQVITINRPEAKNALDAAVARGVADAVDELDADPTCGSGC